LPEILAAAGIDDPVLVGHSAARRSPSSMPAAGEGSRAGARGAARVPRRWGFEALRGARGLRTRLPAPAPGEIPSDVDRRLSGVGNRPWLDPEFRNWNLEEFLPRIAAPRPESSKASRMGTAAGSRTTPSAAVGRSVEVLLLPAAGTPPPRFTRKRRSKASRPSSQARRLARRRYTSRLCLSAVIRQFGHETLLGARVWPPCCWWGDPRATTTAAAKHREIARHRHQDAGRSPPKQPQRRSMPLAGHADESSEPSCRATAW